MISVKIGQQERTLDEVDEAWVSREVHHLHSAGQAVCARVRIHTPELHMLLATRGCPAEGASRPPEPKERRVFELWEKRGLSAAEFAGGQLIAFLKQVQGML